VAGYGRREWWYGGSLDGGVGVIGFLEREMGFLERKVRQSEEREGFRF